MVCLRVHGGGGGQLTGLLNKGRGSNRLPGLVTKQHAVEFPQVQASNLNSFCLVILIPFVLM